MELGREGVNDDRQELRQMRIQQLRPFLKGLQL